jgi:hypothetical protein
MGRYYDASIGRFLTRDSRFGNVYRPQTLNKYYYCLNNPLKFIDPDGRDPVGILIEDMRGAEERGPQTEATIETILALLAIIFFALGLLCTFIGSTIAAGLLASAFSALGYIFGTVSFLLTLVLMFVDFGPEGFEDWTECLYDFLDKNDLTEKDIDDTIYNREEGTVTIVINEGEEDERTVVFEENEDGEWEVVYDSAEENEQDNDGEGNGGEGNGGEGNSSSSPPAPPGNNNGSPGVM